jgi:hypothetical protein
MKLAEKLRKQNKLCPVWKPETILSRLQRCRVMLALHDCLTEAENEKVKQRIAKLTEE